jgi:hypothetical protein
MGGRLQVGDLTINFKGGGLYMSRQADILNILERFKNIEQPERNPEGTEANCLECGSLFYRLNENQIYCDHKCSNRHRQRAFRKRNPCHKGL